MGIKQVGCMTPLQMGLFPANLLSIGETITASYRVFACEV